MKVTDINRKDVLEYEKLLQSAHGKTTKFSLSHLYRTNVLKEIWFGQNPLYVRIECARSELVAAQGESFGAIEKMEDVKSLYQEKLFYQLSNGGRGYMNHAGKLVMKEGDEEIVVDPSIKTLFPMQEVRYFEAKTGLCSYKKLDFIGEDVMMKKYRLRGHIPPPFISMGIRPLSTGEGKKMHFLLKEKGVDLRLDGLKTTFNPKEGM